MSRDNLSFILNERPEGDIVPGVTFRQKSNPIPKPEDVKDGEVLAETLYLGLEPAMRGWLNGKNNLLFFDERWLPFMIVPFSLP